MTTIFQPSDTDFRRSNRYNVTNQNIQQSREDIERLRTQDRILREQLYLLSTKENTAENAAEIARIYSELDTLHNTRQPRPGRP